MVKEYDITIPKQDYFPLPFHFQSGKKLNENDLIFMTVKRSVNDENYIFQKSLDNGITWDESKKRYLIEINSKDTKNMQMRSTYGYDITVYFNGTMPKQQVLGKLNIGEKYTLNEVV